MPTRHEAFARRYNIFKNNFFAFTFSGTESELRTCLIDLGNRCPGVVWDAVPFDRSGGGDRRGTTPVGLV